MANTEDTEAQRWESAYANAAEELFGLVDGDTCTEEQDEAIIARAKEEMAAL